MDESKTVAANEARAEINESGSTIAGGVSALLALLFLYISGQRLWWSLNFGQSDYLMFGLAYLVMGMIFAGVTVYGLFSKRTGVSVSGQGSILIGGFLWLLALYYWIQGMFLGGTADDIFNALSLGFGGIVLYAVGFVSLYIGRKRGLIEKQESDHDINLGETADEIRESAKEGSERGDKIGEQIRGTLDSLPSAIWSVGVLVGIGLGVLSWVLAGLELINAFGIVMVASIIFLVFSIMEDIGRLNRATDLDFNWWAYALPAMVPVVGFVFGFVWLLRKRQKTGTIF